AVGTKGCRDRAAARRRPGAEGLRERGEIASVALRLGHESRPAVAKAEQSRPRAPIAGPAPRGTRRGRPPRLGVALSLATDTQQRTRHTHQSAVTRILRQLFLGWHASGRGLGRRTRGLVGCPEPAMGPSFDGPRVSPSLLRTGGLLPGS